MKNDWPKYEEAWDDYKRDWRILDECLYRLCSDNPGHNSLDAINAKVWIIGRAYATGIERSAEKGPGQALGRVARCLFENRQGVNSIFNELETISEPLSIEKLSVILGLHGRLNQILKGAKQPSGKPLLRDNRSARSFVSKYMHFHCPAVPIYDSIGSARIRKFYRWKNSYRVCDEGKADELYYWFCMRFWQLYQQAPEDEKTVKRLDNYLRWFG